MVVYNRNLFIYIAPFGLIVVEDYSGSLRVRVPLFTVLVPEIIKSGKNARDIQLISNYLENL